MQVKINSKVNRNINTNLESMAYIVTKDPINSGSNASGYIKSLASHITSSGNTESSYICATITGLDPNTQYYYWIIRPGTNEYISNTLNTENFGFTYLGKFKTFPVSSAEYSFSASFASCNLSNTVSSIFNKISIYNPNVFIHTGDMNYLDGSYQPTSSLEYEKSWELSLASGSYYSCSADGSPVVNPPVPNWIPKMARTVPIDYIWDDHDFGPNNSDGSYINKAHASEAYKSIFPHYTLNAPIETYTSGSVSVEHQPIYHSYNIGRVKFIVTDNRSQRTQIGALDNASKIVWYPNQENWFKSQMTSSDCPVKVWVNSFPWEGDDNVTDYTGDDGWEKYTTYRTKISNFISENTSSIGKLIIVSGDAHMTAIDDGLTSPWYSGHRPIPSVTIFQSAPLDQTTSRKGGPYILSGSDIWQNSSILAQTNDINYQDYLNNLSSSYIKNNGMYGCMEVRDNLSHITMSLYSRENISSISEAGNHKFPTVNNTFKKYNIYLDTSNYIVGQGGPITQSYNFE